MQNNKEPLNSESKHLVFNKLGAFFSHFTLKDTFEPSNDFLIFEEDQLETFRVIKEFRP